MMFRRSMLGATALATAAAVAASGAMPQTHATPKVQLYTLDCGRIDFDDEAVFSDTGEHDGQRGIMPVTCFLVRHGTDWLLWDAGLGDEIADSPHGRTMVGLHFRVPRTMKSQLDQLGLRPDDIRYVGLSHMHADHSGNARLFPNATFLISPKELAWAGALPTPDGVLPDRVAAVARSHVQEVPGDLDLFGDGTVRMLSTPGHTPGHHSLMVMLQKTGAVILSGDIAHFQENYDKDLVPLGNFSRAETVASIERVKGLAAHFHAHVIIQHGAGVLEHKPVFPSFME